MRDSIKRQQSNGIAWVDQEAYEQLEEQLAEAKEECAWRRKRYNALRTAAERVVKSLKEECVHDYSDEPESDVWLVDGHVEGVKALAAALQPEADKPAPSSLTLADFGVEGDLLNYLEGADQPQFGITDYALYLQVRLAAEVTRAEAAEQETERLKKKADAMEAEREAQLEAVREKLRSFRNGYVNQKYPVSAVAIDFCTCLEILDASDEGE